MLVEECRRGGFIALQIGNAKSHIPVLDYDGRNSPIAIVSANRCHARIRSLVDFL